MWSNHLKVFYGGTHECCKSYGSSKFHGGKCIYIYICYINNCMEIHAVWGDVGLFDTGFLSPNGLRYIVPAGGWQHMVPRPQKGT